MEGILKFDLPQEQGEFEAAQKGSRAISYLLDFQQQTLRRWLKYDKLTDEQVKVVEEINTEFWDLFGELIQD